MSVAIGCPTRRNADWSPDVSIRRLITPTAVFIQIFVAGHFRRNILRTANSVIAAIPVQAPASEIILSLDFPDVVAQLVDSVEHSLLPLDEAVRTAAPGDFRRSMPHDCRGLVSVFIYIDSVFARFSHIER